MKKFIGLLLCLCLVSSLGAAAFASGTYQGAAILSTGTFSALEDVSLVMNNGVVIVES